MKYSLDKSEKYSILKITQEKLDTSTAPDYKSEFVKLQAEGSSNMILDLSDVKYVDSSGLSALLVGNRCFSEAGGIFVMIGMNDHVVNLIKISQLDKVLNIVPTKEEAIDTVFLHEIESGLEEEEE
ncbi:MAG: STAS domain-containing protein [Imperialibacter sp.]